MRQQIKDFAPTASLFNFDLSYAPRMFLAGVFLIFGLKVFNKRFLWIKIYILSASE